MINAELLKLVIEASNDGIVLAEQEGDENILIYANPAFLRLTGYSVDDILYQDCRFLQGDDRDQAGLTVIREVIRNLLPCRQVIRNYRKDVSVEVEARERVRELEAEVAQLKNQLAQLQSKA
jgi:PAS domain S-box-containing protein